MMGRGRLTAILGVVGVTSIAQASDCLPRLKSFLNYDPTVYGQITIENRISVLIAEDAYVLRRNLRTAKNPGTDPSESCRPAAETALNQLDQYFSERLTWLLDQQDPSAFYSELQNLLAPTIGDAEKWPVYELIAPLKQRYLEAVREDLRRELAADPVWARYAEFNVSIQVWTPEWTKLLGHNAPAAVELDTGRVALRPFGEARDNDYSPDVLKVFLIHEIAHLVAHHDLGLANQYDNEVFAWKTTLAYLARITAMGKTIPPMFARIASTIRLVGLETWVRLVLVSSR